MLEERIHLCSADSTLGSVCRRGLAEIVPICRFSSWYTLSCAMLEQRHVVDTTSPPLKQFLSTLDVQVRTQLMSFLTPMP